MFYKPYHECHDSFPLSFYAYAEWKSRTTLRLLDLDRGELLGREGSVSPMCGCTLCLGLPYKNSVLKAVFNETTHCVLLHSLLSFTLYLGGFTDTVSPSTTS